MTPHVAASHPLAAGVGRTETNDGIEDAPEDALGLLQTPDEDAQDETERRDEAPQFARWAIGCRTRRPAHRRRG